MINITLAQFDPVLGDKNKNLENIIALLLQAKKQNSDLVLLPELALTGYSIFDYLDQMAEDINGPSLQKIKTACKKIGIHLVFTFPEINEKKQYFISAAFIDDDGKLIGVYRKTHLFNIEKLFFERGADYPVFVTRFGKIGLSICYDVEFPEVVRIYRLKNAQILLTSTANMLPYRNHQQTYVASRAMENQIPIAICNRVGNENGTIFFGESTVIDPYGKNQHTLNDKATLETIPVQLSYTLDSNINYIRDIDQNIYKTLDQALQNYMEKKTF